MTIRLARRAALALPALIAWPARAQDRPDLAAVFRDAGATGCFALLDAATGALVTVDARRAGQRFIPASSFKVPNALIALETGVVASVDTIIPYGGRPQPNPAWQRDMSMRDAMPLSAVPIFQDIARRVGLPRYRDWLARLDYGNRDPGRVVDQFWLRGPLAISAVEQVRFLAKLGTGTLRASPAHQAAVREILLIERVGDAAIHGKTGWTGGSVAAPTGWWVGWVARPSGVHAFALNMVMTRMDQAPMRLAIARVLLGRLGVLPDQS